MVSLDALINREPTRNRSSFRSHALRTALVTPLTLFASACFTPAVPISDSRSFEGCVTAETFTKGGAVAFTTGRIPDKHELIIDLPELRSVTYTSRGSDAIANDAAIDKGDKVRWSLKVTEYHSEGNEKAEASARARLKHNTDFGLFGKTGYAKGSPEGNMAYTVELVEKSGCQ
jgi:hypothetical protein